MNGQIAEIANDIWIGNCEACQQHIGKFSRRIHIWHDTQPGFCDRLRLAGIQRTSDPGTVADGHTDLSLEYLEGSIIGVDRLSAVYDFAKQDGRMLIHCAAGIGRSSTLAVVALAARGADPFDALAMIARSEWKQYHHPHCPHFKSKRLNEIIKWLEGK